MQKQREMGFTVAGIVESNHCDTGARRFNHPMNCFLDVSKGAID